ncbi:type II secretion system protein N [Hyphomonas sp.]|uniref:type II secretion system protein N n=1 Tax=Hyphomonas sp. TaxID=87 RepID=UPI003528F74D
MLTGGSAVENIRRGLLRFAGPSIMVTEVLLIAGLAVILAKIGWLIVEPGGAVLGQQPMVLRSNVDGEPAGKTLVGDMTLLVTSNPFSLMAEPVEDVQEAPETNLNLVLKGVRASADGTGVAMIVMPNNRLSIFAPGETILDGVVLDRVYGDRVTLRKDGQIEALLMSSGADRLSVLSSPGDPEPRTSGSNAAGDDGLISTTASDFLANLAINPVHRGQDFVGYEISSRGDAALLELSGLKSGDIILSVDGVSIGATGPGELAMKLSSSRKVRLRIDRNGRQIDQIFTLPENP